MVFFDMQCANCNSVIKKGVQLLYLSKKTNQIYNNIQDMAASGSKMWDLKILCITCAEIEKEKNNKSEKATLTNSNLIECPDCGKSISKRAKTCLNCGCPISDILTAKPDEIKPVSPQNKSISPSINKPKCPTCESSNIEKISLANKAGSVALVGIFALGRVSKTFKCNNCGHKW